MDKDEFKHAVNVLRLKEGDEIIVSDGSGYDFCCLIRKINKTGLQAEIIKKELNLNECKNKVTLLCGYLKNDKNDIVVQKCTELGISKIVFFSSGYVSAYANENKLLRLKKIALEAAKQCKRAIVPEILYFDNFNAAVESCFNVKNKIIAYENSGENNIILKKLSGNTAICVGSEGGFSEKEIAFAKERGFTEISLGRRVMRAETCAVVLTGIVMYNLGELNY